MTDRAPGHGPSPDPSTPPPDWPVEQRTDDAGRASPAWVLRLGAVLWPSFLAAIVATGVFFSQIDPDELRIISFPELQISRMAGYTIGFFMFWGLAAFSSALTLLLLTRPRQSGSREPQ